MCVCLSPSVPLYVGEEETVAEEEVEEKKSHICEQTTCCFCQKEHLRMIKHVTVKQLIAVASR